MQLRPCHRNVPRDIALRVDQLAMVFGRPRAAQMLGIGTATLDAAREEGRMQVRTLDRLVEALEAVSKRDA